MIDMDISGCLAHDLLTCSGFLRHKNQYISFNLGYTTKS